MTDPRRQRFLPYVRQLADTMGLKDWKIAIEDVGPDGKQSSCVLLRYGIKSARIKLSDEFLGEDRETQRADLVHELVHCHFAAADGLIEDWLDEEKYKGYVRIWEYGIDGVADAWAESLPPPDDPSRTAANGGLNHAVEKGILQEVHRIKHQEDDR